MPYIKEEDRKRVDPFIETLEGHGEMGIDKQAGIFTYIVYRFLRDLFGGKFWVRALGIGCLVCAILEWYRRDVGPYEDDKIQENGDVK